MPRKNKKQNEMNVSSEDIEDNEKSEYLHVRSVICERLYRFSNFLEQISLENVDRFEIETRLQIIEEDFSKFNKIQTRLEFLNPNEKQNRLITESDFYSKISNAKRLISRLQGQEQTMFKNQMFPNSQPSAIAALPDLGLPKFYGNCESWYSFWDQFKAIVENRSDISDVRKLMYLKSCCQDDALKLIENIDLIANNYSIAIDLLKKRYENRRAIINSHINTSLYTKQQTQNVNKIVGHIHTQESKPSYTNLNKNSNYSCIICKEHHFIYNCPRFANLSISEKYNEINKNKLCANCLRSGHNKQDCFSSGCKKCNRKHNTTLHIDNNKFKQYNQQNKNLNQNFHESARYSNNVNVGVTPQSHESRTFTQQTREGATNDDEWQNASAPMLSNTRANITPTMCIIGQNSADTHNKNSFVSNQNMTHTFTTIESNQILLSTATILIQNKDKKWIKCTALLDSGSQSNLISKSFFEKLKLNSENINIPLTGINKIETQINSKTVTKIKSRHENFETELHFLILPEITEKLPLIKFEKTQLSIPCELKLADEKFNIPKTIDILIGAEIFFDLLKTGKFKLGNNLPTLQKTVLGWVITENLSLNENENKNNRTLFNFSKIPNKQLNDNLKVEKLETKISLSTSYQFCENYFKSTTTRKENGSFVLKYPFKQNSIEKLANRIARLTEISKVKEWKHVRKKDNAADIISRGLNLKELVNNKILFNGPDFLKNKNYLNSTYNVGIDIENLPEIKMQTLSLITFEQ